MKKSIIPIIIYLVLLTPFLSLAEDADDSDALATLKEGKVWVDTSFEKGESSAISQFRAWIPYSPEIVWKVFIHTNAYKAMHDDYKDSQTLNEKTFLAMTKKPPQSIDEFYQRWDKKKVSSFYGREIGEKWTSYAMQYLNLPWPFKNRWNILKIENDETNAEQGSYKYTYKAYAGNFKELEGYWELLPHPEKEGWTEFRGQYSADAGIKLPKFITKKVMKSSMRKSVKQKIEFIKKFEKTPIEKNDQ